VWGHDQRISSRRKTATIEQEMFGTPLPEQRIIATFHVVAKLRAVTRCAGVPPNCDHPAVVRGFGRRISRDLRGEKINLSVIVADTEEQT
jgi:hypothetical protein